MDIFRKHVFTFRSEEQACAFVEGIEFVNDSSLEIENVEYDGPECWIVSIVDYDKEKDEGEDSEL